MTCQCKRSCVCSPSPASSPGGATGTDDRKWRIFGYTAHQLADERADSLGGYDRDSPLRAVEMVAHLMSLDAELVVIQRVRE